MKGLVLSDLQGIYHRDWTTFLEIDQTRFDFVLLLGDIDQMYLEVIAKKFAGKRKFGVLGNHDYPGDLEYYGIENSHGKLIQVEELSFAGIEGSVKYKKEFAPMFTQEEAMGLCKHLPKANILVSHNSPKGIHDKPDLAHEGFYGLLEYIHAYQPKYALHGHQHGLKRTQIGNTQVVCIFGGVIFDFETGSQERVLEVME